MGAPTNTPADVIDTLNSAINACHADPTTRARFAEFGAVPLPNPPGALGKFIAEDIQKWARVIKFAGAKAD